MHWLDQKLQSRVVNGKTVPMTRHYLFNEKGTLLGRVEKQKNGSYIAYAGGHKAVELGTHFNLGDAKQAVKATIA